MHPKSCDILFSQPNVKATESFSVYFAPSVCHHPRLR